MREEEATTDHDSSRRQFVKKSLYVAPAILTLPTMSAFAKAGSAVDGEGTPGQGMPDKGRPGKRRGRKLGHRNRPHRPGE